MFRNVAIILFFLSLLEISFTLPTKSAPTFTPQRFGTSTCPSYPSTTEMAKIKSCFKGKTSSKAKLIFCKENNELYTQMRRGYNRNSASNSPAVILMVYQKEDVQAAVLCARELELPVNIMGGGHSAQGGFMTDGIMLKMDHFNNVIQYDFESEPATITVESGIRSARAHAGIIYYAMNSTRGPNFILATGTDEVDVGSAGHTLCGGYGNYFSRKLGFASDQLLEVTLVNANGEIVTANVNENPELFWALRGGCSSAFGMVLSLKFRLHYHPGGKVTTCFFKFPLSARTKVWKWMTEYAPTAPDEFTAVIKSSKDFVQLAYLGDYEKATAAIFTEKGLKALQKIAGIQTSKLACKEQNQEDFVMSNYAADAINPTGDEPITLEQAFSSQFLSHGAGATISTAFIFDRPMTEAQVDTMLSTYDTNLINFIEFKARNGVFSKQHPDRKLYNDDSLGVQTRGSSYAIEFQILTDSGFSDTAAINLMNKVKKSLDSVVITNSSYPGYMYFDGLRFPSGPDYFGKENTQKLIALRQKVDPDNIFSSREAFNLYPVPCDPNYNANDPALKAATAKYLAANKGVCARTATTTVSTASTTTTVKETTEEPTTEKPTTEEPTTEKPTTKTSSVVDNRDKGVPTQTVKNPVVGSNHVQTSGGGLMSSMTTLIVGLAVFYTLWRRHNGQ